MNKIHFKKPVRYSEDIDVVQIKPEPIGEFFDRFRKCLSFLGKPEIRQRHRNNTLIFQYTSEIQPVQTMKLKIEINCREHFNILGLKKMHYDVKSRWFSGSCDITTYSLEEMLGTKLRAIYQRKKGRDLFDLFYVMSNFDVDISKILECFYAHLEIYGYRITRSDFLNNLEEKLQDADFLDDITDLLVPSIYYNPQKAKDLLEEKIFNQLFPNET